MDLESWALYGVQELWVHGPTRALGPNLVKSTKCFFSYNLFSTVLMVCHNDTRVVVPSGCSGILGPWSHKGPRALYWNHTKCPSYKFCCTVLMVCHNDSWVVIPSGCSGILGPWSNKGPIGWNLTKHFFFYNFCFTVLIVCHNDTWVVVPSGCSGILGPWSNKGPGPNLVKSYKMLLLLQFLFYSVDGVS